MTITNKIADENLLWVSMIDTDFRTDWFINYKHFASMFTHMLCH
jgi:hypothetical protein